MNDITLCPKCGSSSIYVTDSRKDCGRIRRRKKCNMCDFRFTTYEVPAIEFVKIQKTLHLIAELQSVGSVFDEIKGLTDDDLSEWLR